MGTTAIAAAVGIGHASTVDQQGAASNGRPVGYFDPFVWDGRALTEHYPPPARSSTAVAAYDSLDQQLFMFGGEEHREPCRFVAQKLQGMTARS